MNGFLNAWLMPDYLIPKESIEHLLVAKKSRFITLIRHCRQKEDFKIWLQEVKEELPGANHYCWAHIFGAPDNSNEYGFSDDGEPTGTAGKPMIQALQTSGLGEIAVIIVRFFGGIKLGMGGMIRAYGGAVREALDVLPTELKRDLVEVNLRCDYSAQKTILYCLDQVEGEIKEQVFQEEVFFCFNLPADKVDLFSDLLRDKLHNQVRLELPD